MNSHFEMKYGILVWIIHCWSNLLKLDTNRKSYHNKLLDLKNCYSFCTLLEVYKICNYCNFYFTWSNSLRAVTRSVLRSRSDRLRAITRSTILIEQMRNYEVVIKHFILYSVFKIRFWSETYKETSTFCNEQGILIVMVTNLIYT